MTVSGAPLSVDRSVMLEAVRLLSAGYSVVPERLSRRGAPWARRRFLAGFALVVHRQHGPVLFDTGYTHRFSDRPRSIAHWLYARVTPASIPPSEEAHRQLSSMGIAPGDIRVVVVSHFHADHIAGLRDFPNARIVCTRAAWNVVRGLHGSGGLLHGCLPHLLPPDVEQRLTFVDEFLSAPVPAGMEWFGAGGDLFGDGSALLVHLPGHAVGQIGLFVPALDAGPLFLVADAAWSPAAIASGTPPPRVVTAVLGDTRSYRATLARLAALQRAVPDLRLVASHAAQPDPSLVASHAAQPDQSLDASHGAAPDPRLDASRGAVPNLSLVASHGAASDPRLVPSDRADTGPEGL
jgi:glyoxylase-like metal-dependent hydrolase (beta-lactamase superfamily II)